METTAHANATDNGEVLETAKDKKMRAETYGDGEVNAPRLQKNQQMHNHNRPDARGNRKHKREQAENQRLIAGARGIAGDYLRNVSALACSFLGRANHRSLQGKHDEQVNCRINKTSTTPPPNVRS